MILLLKILIGAFIGLHLGAKVAKFFDRFE